MPCSQVVPGKFVAFKGPVDLGRLTYRDDGAYRKFSPSYYLPIFAYLGVTAVVRLAAGGSLPLSRLRAASFHRALHPPPFLWRRSLPGLSFVIDS